MEKHQAFYQVALRFLQQIALSSGITLLATLVYVASQQPLKSKQAAGNPPHSD
jgi:hypothetical protein